MSDLQQEEIGTQGDQQKKPDAASDGNQAKHETTDPIITPNLRAEALLLGTQGYRVLPLFGIVPIRLDCDCGRESCNDPPEPGENKRIKKGKHPRINKWQVVATTDQQQITEWWKPRRWETACINANIAIATGFDSDSDTCLVGIDIDPDKGGLESLAQLESEYGPLPTDCVVNTGGGGFHVYVYTLKGVLIASTSDWKINGKHIPGIDIRAEGGYVIAPPSNHYSGGSYSWKSRRNREEVPRCPDSWWNILPKKVSGSEKVTSSQKPKTSRSQDTNSKLQDTKPKQSKKSPKPVVDSSPCTDNPDTPDIIQIISVLPVETRTRDQLVEAIQLTFPQVDGIRNSRLIQLGQWLLRIPEVKDWDAEKFEPVIKVWLDTAVKYIGKRDWLETWTEWRFIWGVWLDPTGKYEYVRKAYEVAMSKSFPPMPDNYRSEKMRQLVALCAAMQETAADEDGVWFMGCRDAALVVGLVSKVNGEWKTEHTLVATFMRKLVRDGIIEKVGVHLRGSLKAQRYRYLGWKPKAEAAAA